MRHSNAQDWKLSSPAEEPTPESVDDALGVIRDAIAALVNVESLLRSPKVSARALSPLMPGLHEQRPRVTEAVFTLATHLSANEMVRPAMEELLAFIVESRERYGKALERARGSGLQSARERLAFENEASRMLKDLRTCDELTALLLSATRARATEIDLRELIEQAFMGSRRGGELRHPGLSVIVALQDAPWALHASPAILMPLITLAVALVHGATGARPSLRAEHGLDGSLSLVVSDAPLEGDALVVFPPALIPPVIPCAKVAARLAGGEMRVGEGQREIILRWSRG